MLSAVLQCIPGKSDAEYGSRWLPLWMHLEDTAGIILYLLNNWLPSCEKERLSKQTGACTLERLCRFLAYMHDIGKITPAFVCRIVNCFPEVRDRIEYYGLKLDGKERSTPGTPHALAGEAILKEYGCPDGVASIIGTHHGKPADYCDPDEELEVHFQHYYGREGRNSESGRIWERIRKEWFTYAMQQAGFSDVSELPDLDQPAEMLLSGLLIMADWIASNPSYFPLIDLDDTGKMDAYPDRTASAWRKLNLPQPWTPVLPFMDADMFRERFGFLPNPEQQMMMEAAESGSGAGIYILEAQMGRGKTEAALAAAEIIGSRLQCGGVFFGLPTQATANGLFVRLKEWAEKQSEDCAQSIRLAHGMAELNEDYKALFEDSRAHTDDEDSGLIVHQWFQGRKQALLADFVIGTVDQFLMAALKQKHVMLRHTGLAGKIVILDECHAYDTYMMRYLDTALAWLGAYNVPVIILSATLPAARRAELIDAYLNLKKPAAGAWRDSTEYPLLTWTTGETVQQRGIRTDAPNRQVELERWTDGHIIDGLREALIDGGCAGVIVNTVSRAQEIAGTLSIAMPEAEVQLFHSHFIAPDRAEREAELVRRIGKHGADRTGSRLIVVGTQVLEQSLDIDFDIMITDLCPMDLLLQRIGRLQRHSYRRRPEHLQRARCAVLGTGDELEKGSRRVYGDWLLLRTRELLPDRITLPDDIPVLVQETYRQVDKTDLGDAEAEAWEEQSRRDALKKDLASRFCLKKPGKKPSKLDGLLLRTVSDDEKQGLAAVRDTGPSIRVLILQRKGDRIGFLPWQYNGAAVAHDRIPEEDTARRIASQQMNLPFVFCFPGQFEKTVRELEERNGSLASWQQSPWLRGELVLLLDENCRTTLCGYELTYSRESGLTYTKGA